MLRFESVRKAYGPKIVVVDLDLEIAPGEIVGLLGPNGAGKTTTVRLAAGLATPDAGSVLLVDPGQELGNSPTLPTVRRLLGVAPQELALYDELSGLENVTFFGRIQGLAGRELATGVQRALEVVGLVERAKDRVATYSGGMKRRLNLAAAIVHDPPILLLDEPTVGVDPQSRNAILDRIRDLRRDGRSILYTTHYMEEAQRLCDRVAIIDHGRILDVGSVDELLERHGGRSALYLESEETLEEERIETEDPVGELSRRAAAGRLTRFRVEQPDLETVFLEMTGRNLRD